MNILQKSSFLLICTVVLSSVTWNISAHALFREEKLFGIFRQPKTQPGLVSQNTSGLIEVLSPVENEKISAPIKVIISINAIESPVIAATLNGKDISRKFLISENNVATASLEEKDGVLFGAKNQLRVTLKRSGTPIARVIRHFFAELKGTTVIPPIGGKVTLPNVGTIIFQDGSFSKEQSVSLSATKSVDTDDDFKTTSIIFGAEKRLPYELRVNSGSKVTEKPIKALISVPNDFLRQVKPNSEIQVLAGILQNGGADVLYSFELFSSKFISTSKTIEVELPPAAFTNLLSKDGTYEAAILLTTTPTKATKFSPSNSGSFSGREKALPVPPDARRNNQSIPRSPQIIPQFRQSPFAASVCQGSTLAPPLNGTLTVTGKFNAAPKPPNHYGTDFRAANGTPVLSMADGTVKAVGFQVKPLEQIDPRTKKKLRGWGHYVVLQHTDGSRTLYAHLLKGGIKVRPGQVIKQGQQIALSDSSGIGSGPHLHVEYAPNGKIFDKGSKVDPEPCIGKNVKGSITVRDNGSLADDAFELKLNGLSICKTLIGASNTCGIGNLRPGTATLSITALIAPDNVGTYEIKLSDGLTFSDGTTIRSSTLPEGGTDTFTIKIPSK